MRAPSDLPRRAPRPVGRRRGRRWIAVGVVLLTVLLGSLKSLATLYTDSLWFGSVNLHSVFTTLLGVKLGLFFVFGAIFFAILWINLIICDRLGRGAPEPPAEDELVRRYQQTVGP